MTQTYVIFVCLGIFCNYFDTNLRFEKAFPYSHHFTILFHF